MKSGSLQERTYGNAIDLWAHRHAGGINTARDGQGQALSRRVAGTNHNPYALLRDDVPISVLTLIHKSWRIRTNTETMGSTVLESKHYLYGCVIRVNQPVESCYAQQLSMAFLLLGDAPPSHGNGRDFPDARFVYKCQSL